MAVPNMLLLNKLAASYGIEAGYQDLAGAYRCVSPETLLAVLRALGAPVEGLTDVPDAFRRYRQDFWRRCCSPVVVAWQGNKHTGLELRLPAAVAGWVQCRLALENGRVFCWTRNLRHLPVLRSTSVEGVNYTAKLLYLPPAVPEGYHHLKLSLLSKTHEVMIIAAPQQAYVPPPGMGRMWGIFLPLYALHSRQSRGSGDLCDLASLLRWVAGLGGNIVGTLPLLSAYLDEPFVPSPYEPVSRLFWNEFYLNLDRVEELQESKGVQETLNAACFRGEVELLRQDPLVDYSQGMALKRRLLEEGARCIFTGNSTRQTALQDWVQENPRAWDYARFRAATERRGEGWPAWPGRMREGEIREGDFDRETERYHLYVQWLTCLQFTELSTAARRAGQKLYLDLPLGVHREGYDVWRFRDSFALEASTGAPPDMFFQDGQDWGFPPLHPERIREQGYKYYIDCLRHHLHHAGVLRLDHVAGLHRLFWVPGGAAAREGVYVRYHAQEFFAILCLESRRYQSIVVGEDLGTVPACVREMMSRRQVQRMYVLPFEHSGDRNEPLRPVPRGALACLDTHDMPPFAGYWQGKERTSWEKVALPLLLYRYGLLSVPTNQARAVMLACLAYLASSQARVVMVNLEDLWQEALSQNLPGTAGGANWRRKARYSLEEFSVMPEVVEVLQEVNRLRRQAALNGRSGATEGGTRSRRKRRVKT